MSDNSKIEWTQATWSPTTGCDRVSAGCDNCYALTMAKRLKGMGQAKYQRDGDPHTSGPGFGLTVHEDTLAIPLRWREPRRIFVNSMSDLFHEEVPDEFLCRVFDVMQMAPRHTFQVLTKRHARMRSFVTRYLSGEFAMEPLDTSPLVATIDRPPRNIWLGVSAEDQRWADIRVPALLKTPAAVRFVSAEPLLGPIDLDRYLWLQGPSSAGPFYDHAGRRRFGGGIGGQTLTRARANDLHWVIAGGESGPGARPCELNWLRSLRDQCADAEVPFFCKQLGAMLGRELGAGSHGADWDAWPADLRIREFPRTTEVVPA
jgi:protein gp37